MSGELTVPLGSAIDLERIVDYLAMDGRAAYVWPALAIAALVLIALTVWSVAQLRASNRRLAELQPVADQRRDQRRAAREQVGAASAQQKSAE
ncbi:MAG: heme exporter protein CcmD [Alphaproteobacteria bacterium]|nr:heme exporter protein CcmD [Alphaproteobacteria bacterium]MCZ6763478.1 heme exporter protein CcmD [Alphaproteobacteria bacterium]